MLLSQKGSGNAHCARHLQGQVVVTHLVAAPVAPHVGDHLVVYHRLRWRDGQLGLQLPHPPDGADSAFGVRVEPEHLLQRRLLVRTHRLGRHPRGGRQPVEPPHQRGDAGEKRVLRPPGNGDRRLHIEDVSQSQVVDARSPRLQDLVDDDPGQNLSVPHSGRTGQGNRPRNPRHRFSVDRDRQPIARRPPIDLQGQVRPAQRSVRRKADAQPGEVTHHLLHLDDPLCPLGREAQDADVLAAVAGDHLQSHHVARGRRDIIERHAEDDVDIIQLLQQSGHVRHVGGGEKPVLSPVIERHARAGPEDRLRIRRQDHNIPAAVVELHLAGTQLEVFVHHLRRNPHHIRIDAGSGTAFQHPVEDLPVFELDTGVFE